MMLALLEILLSSYVLLEMFFLYYYSPSAVSRAAQDSPSYTSIEITRMIIKDKLLLTSVEEGVYPQVESLCGTTTSSRTERRYIIQHRFLIGLLPTLYLSLCRADTRTTC
jgi:hypothetical protein